MTFADKDEEINFWKAAAIYFADCHAATAEILTRRGCGEMSRYDRERFMEIAGLCYAILDSSDMEELKESKGEIWAFFEGYLGTPDLEDVRMRVAKRARNALED